MKVDLDELERKAQAAMQGPWRVSSTDRTKYTTVLDDDSSGDVYVVCDDVTVRNAEHIVAASPSVVLALIAELRALRRLAEAAKVFVDQQGTLASGDFAGDLFGDLEMALEAVR